MPKGKGRLERPFLFHGGREIGGLRGGVNVSAGAAGLLKEEQIQQV